MEYKKIKSFEDACAKLGLDPNALPDVSMIPEKHRKHLIANYKLTIISEALNDGWVLDWDNYSEWKYAPFFVMSGSGFSFFVCDIAYSCSYLGSRLCYKSSEIARYAGQQFLELYRDEMLIP